MNLIMIGSCLHEISVQYLWHHRKLLSASIVHDILFLWMWSLWHSIFEVLWQMHCSYRFYLGVLSQCQSQVWEEIFVFCFFVLEKIQWCRIYNFYQKMFWRVWSLVLNSVISFHFGEVYEHVLHDGCKLIAWWIFRTCLW